MSKRFCIIGFLLIVIVSCETMASEFPTDKGSIAIQGGFSFINTGMSASSSGDKTVTFSGSIDYFVSLDIAIGLWSLYERNSSGASYEQCWVIGKQIKWFIGGHMHKPKFKGDVLPYIGLGAHYTLRTKKSLTSWPMYSKDKSGSAGFKFFFGITTMLLDHIGIYSEATFRIDGDDFNSGGCMGSTGFNSDLRLNIGFSIFLY